MTTERTVTVSETAVPTVPIEKTTTETTTEVPDNVEKTVVEETISVPEVDATREAHRISGAPDHVVKETVVTKSDD